MKNSLITYPALIVAITLSIPATASIAPISNSTTELAIPTKTTTSSAQQGAGIQLARLSSNSRLFSNLGNRPSITTRIHSSGTPGTTSPFFSRFVPSSKVGATITTPRSSIVGSPRVILVVPSRSNGFVRKYKPVKRRFHF